jgi:hypothetical protein
LPGVGQTPPEGHIGTDSRVFAPAWAAKVENCCSTPEAPHCGQARVSESEALRMSLSKRAPQSRQEYAEMGIQRSLSSAIASTILSITDRTSEAGAVKLLATIEKAILRAGSEPAKPESAAT